MEMSDNEEKVDQITAEPKPKPEAQVRVKDPKEVAAGKALAERNRKAREALKKQEAAEADDTSQFGLDGVVKAAAVVGAGFTLYHGWNVIKPYLSPRKKESYEVPVTATLRVASAKEPEPKNEIREMDME